MTNRPPICLITPPSGFLMDERVFASLGILRVAAVLERDGYPVEHLDLNGITNYEEAARFHAEHTEARVFGLTATTPQMPAAAKIVAALKAAQPEAKLILGGPHATLVNAARKREEKNGVNGRAYRAFGHLADMFDVIVAGDGEDAVFHALMPDAPKLVDADDMASALFMNDRRYDEMPWPARHLIDLSSYHYTIEGAAATSTINQLGCLAAGTQITMADGSQRTIETVREGDYVVCLDQDSGGFKSAPVAKKWRRQAQDMWRLTANNNSELFVTSEHPVWTTKGWKTVGELSEGDQVGASPAGIQFVTITSKQFIGASEVFNITVCPGHSYVANGIIVHNCPYGCAFCGGRLSPTLRRIRHRSVSNILNEIGYLYRTYGFRGVMHYDDELNVSTSMLELMDGLTQLQAIFGGEFRHRGFIKSNLFTDEQAAAMHRAGFRWILVGFESGSPRILENIQKKATREQNSECMAIARRHGLKVKALMSIGHAGETAETVRQTKDWLLEERPDDFDCTVITTYPGTPYYDMAEETAPGIWTYTAPKSGDRLHAYEVDYNHEIAAYKGIPGNYKSLVYTDHLTADDLVRLRDELEADVRERLGIPYNFGAPGLRFETSMGQTARLPANILRETTGNRDASADERKVAVNDIYEWLAELTKRQDQKAIAAGKLLSGNGAVQHTIDLGRGLVPGEVDSDSRCSET